MARAVRLQPELRETIRKDGYRIESVTYEVEPGDRVPAHAAGAGRRRRRHPGPAVAVWHQHNGQWHLGKSEPAGLAGNPMHHTGVALARKATWCSAPTPCASKSGRASNSKGGNFERFEFLRYVVAGKCMAWKNILDMRRAVDYLCAGPEVRADRIGCYGHSMGSTHTWLVGPWEPRLKCLVGNCCLPTYAAIHRTHILHCFPNFIPGLVPVRRHARHRRADRPAGAAPELRRDGRGSPIDEVREGVKTIAASLRRADAADAFSHFIEPDTGHVLSPKCGSAPACSLPGISTAPHDVAGASRSSPDSERRDSM